MKNIRPLITLTATLLASVGGAVVVVFVTIFMRALVFDTSKTLTALMALIMLTAGGLALKHIQANIRGPRIGPLPTTTSSMGTPIKPRPTGTNFVSSDTITQTAPAAAAEPDQSRTIHPQDDEADWDKP